MTSFWLSPIKVILFLKEPRVCASLNFNPAFSNLSCNLRQSIFLLLIHLSFPLKTACSSFQKIMLPPLWLSWMPEWHKYDVAPSVLSLCCRPSLFFTVCTLNDGKENAGFCLHTFTGADGLMFSLLGRVQLSRAARKHTMESSMKAKCSSRGNPCL